MPDFTACANLGDTGYCRTFVTHEKIIIDDSHPYTPKHGEPMTWFEVQRSGVLIPTDQFVELQKWFDNYCHRNQGKCAGDMGKWKAVVDDLAEHAERGLP